jgi:nitrogen fixation protein FixH
MKKMNWGTGITIVIVLFLIITIGQVIAIHYFVDYDLVVEDYYDEEMQFQGQIEKTKRANSLSESIKIKLLDKKVEISFPSIFNNERISGKVQYYKPSDDLHDKVQIIELNKENKLYYDTANLYPGLWKIKINWAVNDVEYYSEEAIMLP